MKIYSRRQALSRFAALSSTLAVGTGSQSFTWNLTNSSNESPVINRILEPYPSEWLPKGVRSRFVDNINGLRMHILEAGYEEKGRPGLLLLHGFPELAYSWRHIMLPCLLYTSPSPRDA